MKKFFAILLSVAMLLTMASVAFAEETTGETTADTGKVEDPTEPTEMKGSITIDNAISGYTYTIYKMLDVTLGALTTEETSEDGTTTTKYNAFAYTVANGWENFFNGEDIKDIYIEFKDEKYVQWKTGADPVEFAKKALEYATDSENSISNDGTKEATSIEVKFEALDLGYYLLDSTMGALCSLDTTTPNVTMHEKNGLPKIDKTIEEDSESKKTNDVNIGDTVSFKTVVTAKSGVEKYVIHDRMSEGLTLKKDSIKVFLQTVGAYTDEPTEEDYKKSNEINSIDSGKTNFTIKTEGLTTEADGKTCTFEIIFDQSFCDTLNTYDRIIVTYDATLNENAKVEDLANTNDTKLTYGDNHETEWSNTKTYTWKFDVLKYTGTLDKTLANAKFSLYSGKDETGALSGKISFKDITPAPTDDNPNPTPTYQYVKTAADGTETIEEIITNETGKFVLTGLDSGTYYLEEVEAPDGYNKLTGPVTVIISATENETDKTMTSTIYKDSEVEDNKAADKVIKVENKTGSELPSTGGIGTTIFYVVGGLLMIGSVVLLVTKKKMSVNDD